jgi:hypothetical protein
MGDGVDFDLGELAAASFALGPAAVPAYSTYKSQQASEEAARERKRASAKQTAREKIKLAASRRQQIREERIRRAQILQRAESLGVGSSSGAAGSTAAVSTTTASNLATQFGEGVAVTSISQNLQKAADLETSARNWGAISDLSMSIFTSAIRK